MSTTASWNDAATSAATASGAPRRWYATAVFRPAKREVEPVAHHRARERHRADVSLAREPVDRGTTGVAEPEEAGDLVERLTRGVVEGLAEHPVLPVVLDRDDHRVTTRHEQHRERRRQVGFLEPRRVQVTLEVVHPDVRDVGRERERLRGAHPDEQRAGEAGTVARGDRVEIARARSLLRRAPPRSPR